MKIKKGHAASMDPDNKTNLEPITSETANKTSGTKSNASESTTLKKVVPAHMVKPVTRH